MLFSSICRCEIVENETILYVGGSGVENYSSIQNAIDNATTGDTIYVYNGTYYEHIIINKTVNLIGEDKETTIIDGNNLSNVIIITADKVNVTGFTLQNSGNVFPKAGINVSSDYNTLSGNIMINNFYGVTLWHSSNNVISENNITNNDHCGMYMSGSSNNIITGNVFRNHQYNGIGIYDSSDNNLIMGNTMNHNNFCGINIRISSNNTVTGNTITNNNIGIHVPIAKYNNHISENVLSDNNKEIEYEYFETSGFEFIVFLFAMLSIVLWKYIY